MLNLTPFETLIKESGLNVFGIRVLQQGQLAGHVQFAEDIRRLQHSISKSFTAMAAGLAIEEGKLSLDTTLKELFPQYPPLPGVSDPAWQPGELTLYNLLRMSSGHDNPPFWAEERATLPEKDWVKHYFSLPLDRVPGEQFTYSSGDTIMISAMIQAAVGETVRDYLVPRLFSPLGIEDVSWETTPLGQTLGCAGLKLNVEELSRFGQLLLQRGEWEGRQLIPSHWIDYATSKRIDNGESGDWGQGYGMQFWMCTHNAYRADGAYGQLCVVIPDKQAVIAINSLEDKMDKILEAVWSTVWPQL